MRQRLLRRVAGCALMIVGFCALALPPAASAQPADVAEPAGRALLLVGAGKSRPLHTNASVGTLIVLRPVEVSDDFGRPMHTYRGVIVDAAVGLDGYRLAAGWGIRSQESRGDPMFGEDIVATWFRAWKGARGNTTAATYVGGEVGHMSLLMPAVRWSVGAARRVAGPAESDRTIFTCGVSVSVGR